MQNKQLPIQIKRVSIEEAFAMAKQVPEFAQSYPKEEYYNRLENCLHLNLMAWVDGQPAGFKVGYERDDMFYSWMGAVLPAFRQMGVAKALADYQEAWAKQSGFSHVFFKTWNQHKGMLIFALKNGFDIVQVLPREQLTDYRIILQKEL